MIEGFGICSGMNSGFISGLGWTRVGLVIYMSSVLKKKKKKGIPYLKLKSDMRFSGHDRSPTLSSTFEPRHNFGVKL